MAFVSGRASRFSNTKLSLDQFAELFIKQLKDNLRFYDKVATRKLINSLGYKLVEREPGVFRITIQAENYLYWVDKGRKAGNPPPIAPLEEWVKARRIQFTVRDGKNRGKFLSYRQTAFIIRKSLTSTANGGKGKSIRPTNVINITISDMVKKYKKLIRDGFRGDLELLINDTFRDIKTNR